MMAKNFERVRGILQQPVAIDEVEPGDEVEWTIHIGHIHEMVVDRLAHQICKLWDEPKPDEGIRFQPTEFPPFKLADEENRGSPPKPDADVPLGVTCHYERDTSGQWWTVWSGDFSEEEPGRKLVEDSLLLEMGYQHARSEQPKPDEGRLLSPEYLDRFDDEFWANCDFYGANCSRCEELKEAVAKAQLAKDTEHEQARVERIFKEIEEQAEPDYFTGMCQVALKVFLDEELKDLPWWREFKKREGKE